MSTNISNQFIFIIVLTCVNAFFSSAEMAIVSLNKTSLKTLADKGNKNAILIQKVLDEPSKFLATIQVGITLCSFLASASAATSIADKFAKFLEGYNIPYSSTVSLVIVTIVLSFVTLIFGELFPKRIALQKSEEIAFFAIKPIYFIAKITRPFVVLLSGCTNILLKLCNVSTENIEEKFSQEEIKSLIAVGQENGVINQTEKDMIECIFEFDDKIVDDVMTPRVKTSCIDIDTPSKEVSDIIEETGYSRMPVYENGIDNIIGILYIKDYLYEAKRNNGFENIDIRKILRTPYFVPEAKNIDILFRDLQASKNQIAVVIDEYGGFSGIVTMEDLIEEIMGNISDEYDDNEFEIKCLNENTYIIDGLAKIDDINDFCNVSIESVHCDTIGGFIIDEIGEIPKIKGNNIIKYKNLEFTIEEIINRRIKKVKMTIISD